MRESNTRNAQIAIFDFQCVAKLKKAHETWALATVGFSKTWAPPTVSFSRTRASLTVGFSTTWALSTVGFYKTWASPTIGFSTTWAPPRVRVTLCTTGTQDEKINRV
jgi:hypothetical protein